MARSAKDRVGWPKCGALGHMIAQFGHGYVFKSCFHPPSISCYLSARLTTATLRTRTEVQPTRREKFVLSPRLPCARCRLEHIYSAPSDSDTVVQALEIVARSTTSQHQKSTCSTSAQAGEWAWAENTRQEQGGICPACRSRRDAHGAPSAGGSSALGHAVAPAPFPTAIDTLTLALVRRENGMGVWCRGWCTVRGVSGVLYWRLGLQRSGGTLRCFYLAYLARVALVRYWRWHNVTHMTAEDEVVLSSVVRATRMADFTLCGTSENQVSMGGEIEAKRP
ncbi:hypothetical protein B0H11DRAFT_2201802 [Mycena galericulata]|nr:hypothetical protein B0H11DRAFT_2201802 [Mycena galericulata]